MTQQEILAQINNFDYDITNGKEDKLAERTTQKSQKLGYNSDSLSGTTADDADSGDGWRLLGGDSPEVYHDVTPTGDTNNERHKVYKQIAYENGISIEDAITQVDGEAAAYKADLEYRNSPEFLDDSLNNLGDTYYNSANLADAVAKYRQTGVADNNAPIDTFDIYHTGNVATDAAKVDAEQFPDANLYNSEKFLTGDQGYYGRELSDNKEYVNRQIAAGLMVPGSNDDAEYAKQLKMYQNAKEKGLGNFSDPRSAAVMDSIFTTGYSNTSRNPEPFVGYDATNNGYVENAVKAGGAAIAGSFYGMADAFVELAGAGVNAMTGKKTVNWDLGSEQERNKFINEAFGYDDTRSAKSMKHIGEKVKKMYDAGEMNWADTWDILKTAGSDADSFMYSLGYLASWAIGGEIGLLGKAGKGARALKSLETANGVLKAAEVSGDAAKIAKATTYVERATKGAKGAQEAIDAYAKLGVASKAVAQTGNFITKNAAFNASVMSSTNDQIDEFKKNNGGKIDGVDIMRIGLITWATQALDRFAMRDILGGSKGLKQAFDAIGKSVGKDGLLEIKNRALANVVAIGKGVVGLGKSMTEEALQEYTQQIGQLFGVQYGTDKYGKDAVEILTNDKNQISALSNAAYGAGGGAQFHAVGTTKNIAGSVISNAPKVLNAGIQFAKNIGPDQFNPEATAIYTDKQKNLHRKASIDQLKKVKSYEAKKLNTQLIMNDAAHEISTVPEVVEGSKPIDEGARVNGVIKTAIDRVKAVEDYTTGAADNHIAAAIIDGYMEQHSDDTAEQQAARLDTVTKGMSEARKKAVYDKVIANTMKKVKQSLHITNEQNQVNENTSGKVAEYTDEEKANAEAEIEKLGKMGSTEGGGNGGYIKKAAEKMNKQFHDFVFPDKNLQKVEKDIFETGFNFNGREYKSVPQHVHDIEEEMFTNIKDENREAIGPLLNFISRRGAGKLNNNAIDPQTKKEYTPEQRITLGDKTFHENEKIIQMLMPLIKTATENGKMDYAQALTDGVNELSDHNKEIQDTVVALGGKIQTNNTAKYKEKQEPKPTTRSVEQIQNELKGIDIRQQNAFEEFQNSRQEDTDKQKYINVVSGLDQRRSELKNLLDNIATNNNSTVKEPSVSSSEQVSTNPSEIQTGDVSTEAGQGTFDFGEGGIDIGSKPITPNTDSEKQVVDPTLEEQMKALQAQEKIESKQRKSNPTYGDSKPNRQIVTDDIESVKRTEIANTISEDVLDVEDTPKIAKLSKEYEDLENQVLGADVSTPDAVRAKYKLDEKRIAKGKELADARVKAKKEALVDKYDELLAANDSLVQDPTVGVTAADGNAAAKNLGKSAKVLQRQIGVQRGEDLGAMKVDHRLKELESRLANAKESGAKQAYVDKLEKQIGEAKKFANRIVMKRQATKRAIDANTKSAIELDGVTVESEKIEKEVDGKKVLTPSQREQLKAFGDVENAMEQAVTDAETAINMAYEVKEATKKIVHNRFQKKIKKLKDELKDARKAWRMDLQTLSDANKGKNFVYQGLAYTWNVLTGLMDQLGKEMQILKAEISKVYSDKADSIKWIDATAMKRIKDLQKDLADKRDAYYEAGKARRAKVKEIIGKHSGYAELKKSVEYNGQNKLFELVQEDYRIDSNIFNRETPIEEYLGIHEQQNGQVKSKVANGLAGLISLVSQRLLPSSMLTTVGRELDAFSSMSQEDKEQSLTQKLIGDITVAGNWLIHGTGDQVSQEKMINIGAEPEMSKEAKIAISKNDLGFTTDANGVKRIALVDKDGKEVEFEGSENYVVNPMAMLLPYSRGINTKAILEGSKFAKVIAMEALQAAASMVEVSNKSGSEMSQFIEGAFGIKADSELYEPLRRLISSGLLPEATFIQSSGRNVLRNMGIKLDPQLDVEQVNALTSAIGQMVMEQMRSNRSGYVEVTQALRMKIDPTDNKIHTISQVRPKGLSKAQSDARVAEEKAFDSAAGQPRRIVTIVGKQSDGVNAMDNLKSVVGAAHTMEYLGMSKRSHGAHGEPGGKHVYGEMTIRGTDTLASEQDVEYVNDQEMKPRTFNETFEAIESVLGRDVDKWNDFLLQDYDTIKKLRANNTEVLVPNMETALTNRRAGEFEVQGLLDTRMEFEDEPWYLDWDVTRSDRFMIDSNVITPQNGKLSRFLVALDGMRSTMKWGKDGFDKDDVGLFLAAASQALGYDIDKGSDVNILEDMKKNHFTLGTDGKITYADTDSGTQLRYWVEDMKKVLAKKDGATLPDMGSIDVNERMHALQLVVALAKVKPGESLEHELVIETDGITNGMIMTLLQIGTDEAMALLEKGGVYYDKFTNDISVKGEDGTRKPVDHGEALEHGLKDIYSTPVEDMEKNLAGVDEQIKLLKDIPEKDKSPKQKKLAAGAYMKGAFDIFGPTDGGKWRKMMKPLVMIYIYGAQMSSIRRNVGYNFSMNVINKMVDEIGNSLTYRELLNYDINTNSSVFEGKQLAAVAYLQYILYRTKPENGLHEFYKFDDVTKTMVRVRDENEVNRASLHGLKLTQEQMDIVSKDMTAVMGDSVEAAFKENFGFIDDYRQTIKSIEMVNYAIYKTELKAKLKKYIGDDGVLRITKEQMTGIQRELEDEGKAYGAINSRGGIQDYKKYDSADKTKTGITGKMVDGSSKQPVTKTTTVKGQEVVPNPGAVGVVTIHDIDGFLMYMSKNNGYQNIFDAYVAGLEMDSLKSTSDIYNFNLVNVSRDHSILHKAQAKVSEQLASMSDEMYKDMLDSFSDSEKKNLEDAFNRINKEYDFGDIDKSVKMMEDIDANRDININGDVSVNHLYVSTLIPAVRITKDTEVGGQKAIQSKHKFKDNSKIVEVLHKMVEAITTTDPDKSTTTEDSKNTSYTNHSGGAKGADTVWGDIGVDYGVTNNHYYTGEKSEYNAPNGNKKISDKDYKEGAVKVAEAAKFNWGYKLPVMKDPRLVRNWSQVKYADAIFAVAPIANKGQALLSGNRVAQYDGAVKGGTGYAVGMAILAKKPVFVFDDGGSNKWYKWDYDNKYMVETDTPTLTKNFAGIGTRGITDAGKQAIKEVYSKTFKAKDEVQTSNVNNGTAQNVFEDLASKIDGIRPMTQYEYYDKEEVEWVLESAIKQFGLDETMGFLQSRYGDSFKTVDDLLQIVRDGHMTVESIRELDKEFKAGRTTGKQIKDTLLEAKKITSVKQKKAGAPWKLPEDAVWVTRVTPAQLGSLDKAGMDFSLIENFGNPFVVNGKKDENVAMNVEMGTAEEVSIMFYDWLKNSVVPEAYPKKQLSNLASRRYFILDNIDKIKNAKELWYWRAPDKYITHVDALVAIAEKLEGVIQKETKVSSDKQVNEEVNDNKQVKLDPDSYSLLVPASTSKTFGNKFGNGFEAKDEVHLTVFGFPQGKQLKEWLSTDTASRTKKLQDLIDAADFGYKETDNLFRIERDREAWIDWKDQAKGKETLHEEAIIQLVEAPGIADFIGKANELTGLDMPVPFPHISLAVKGTKFGIGIADKNGFNALNPERITVDEMKDVKSSNGKVNVSKVSAKEIDESLESVMETTPIEPKEGYHGNDDIIADIIDRYKKEC